MYQSIRSAVFVGGDGADLDGPSYGPESSFVHAATGRRVGSD
ncbi:MAG: hypothetical protein ACR2KW_01270 [Rubrobacter sp.]